MVIEADDRRSAELSVMDNLQKEDLGMFEQANGIASLIDIYGLTSEETAAALGISPSAVAYKLRLLRLTATERMMITRHGISEKHARALLKLCDPEKRLEVLQETIRLECSASATEDMVDRILYPEEEKKTKHRRPVIKDTRIVYNTIDRAIETIEKAGISVEKERKETDETVEVVIRIRKVKRLIPTARPPFLSEMEDASENSSA